MPIKRRKELNRPITQKSKRIGKKKRLFTKRKLAKK